MGQTTLEGLPDDLLIDVVSRLSTAHDVARLGSSSRRLGGFVAHDGWRAFVKSGFPALQTPHRGVGARWAQLAERLAYLDECWEKRAFAIQEYSEKGPAADSGGGRGGRQQQQSRRRTGGQSVSFHPVLAARQLSSLDKELVAWGVGEELVLRVRPTSGAGPSEWHRLDGATSGQSSGFGDVTALSLLERVEDAPEVLIGRANGDLQLVNASGDFSNIVRPAPPPKRGGISIEERLRKSPGQTAVTWTEWDPTSNVIASCKQSTLTLYDVNDSTTNRLAALDSYDLSQDSEAGETSLLRSVKFLSSDTIACALGNAREPVRWAKLTPTGPEFFMASRGSGTLDYLSSVTDVTTDSRTTVRAIETVGRAHSDSLLLAAWDDGTYRLNDVRTPSPHDAVYRDRWDVYDASSSLLVYGSRHFVAGSNVSASLRFFDFRYPKPYHYTNALPCSSEQPYPPPPRDQRPQAADAGYHEACDDRRGKSCMWHAQSREDRYRPDTTLHLGRGRFERVHALAKASDVSGSFFCGLQGSIVEMNLRIAEDTADVARDAPRGWRVEPPSSKIAAVETGISLCREGEWFQQDTGYPELYYQSRQTPPAKDKQGPTRPSRFDAAYRHHSEMPARNEGSGGRPRGSRRGQRRRSITTDS